MSVLSLAKSYDFFKTESCRERLHIIGCGSVGSTLAGLLARFGLANLTLYDFDTVEPHNLANQMFRLEHVGMPKVDALTAMLSESNPEITNRLKPATEGYINQRLSGYVFLCVDNIELRRKIATKNKNNPHIKAIFDFRTRLTDAQHYAADWSNMKMVGDFIRSMDFTHDEVMSKTPVSVCNVLLIMFGRCFEVKPKVISCTENGGTGHAQGGVGTAGLQEMRAKSSSIGNSRRWET